MNLYFSALGNKMPTIIKIIRLTSLVAIFVVPLSVLVVVDSLFFPFIVGKAIIFRALAGLAFFSWFLLALFNDKYRPRNSSILFVFGLFVVWTFVANLFAVNPYKAFWGNFERMDGWLGLLYLFLFFVVLGSILRTRRLWKIFWFISLGVSVIVSVDAIFDVINSPSSVRVSGLLGNPIYLAAYALFHIFIASYYFSISQERHCIRVEEKFSIIGKIGEWIKSHKERVFLSAAFFLNLIILFYSGTRGAMLGLFVGIFISAFLIFIFRYGISRKAIAFMSVILFTGFAILFIARLPGIREHPTMWRVANIFRYQDQNRLPVWKMALEGATDRPLFGWGQEGYNYVFNNYFKTSLFGAEQWYDRAHNSFLDWLVAGGIPALILYLAIFWCLLRVFWKYYKSATASAEQVISMALLIGLVGAYVVFSFFVFDNLITSILFVAVLAYAHVLSATPPRLSAQGLPRQTLLGRKFAFQSRSVGIAIIGGVVAIFITTQFFTNFIPLMANIELARAMNSGDAHVALKYFDKALSYGVFKQEIREQLTLFSSNVAATPGISDNFRIGVAESAIKEMSKQILETPKDARAYVMRSVARRAALDAQGALLDLEKAKEFSPRKQALFVEQGNIAYAVGNKQMAANIFLQAYALDESSDVAAAYAGVGLIAAGKKQDGQAILQKHFGSIFLNNYFVKKAHDNLSL